MDRADRLRMAVLHIDRAADLPLAYIYLPQERAFRTVGYVRLRGVTVLATIRHTGPDTDVERDLFLLKVLDALRIAPGSARRIVRTAEHPDDRGPRVAPRSVVRSAGPGRYAAGPRVPAAGAAERGGAHLLWPGALVGLLTGLLAGWLPAGWNGAAIGAFVGMSTFPDLFIGGWQARHARRPHNYVVIQDTVALLLVAAGGIGGALAGYALAGTDGGFAQARGVFLGLAAGSFVFSLIATAFSMVPFRQRAVTWFGPLIVGGCCWGAFTLWSHPVATALGVVLGSPVAAVLAGRVAGVR
ncbi:hypothetical protein ACWGIB_05185 [Streptomyces xiamenensis]